MIYELNNLDELDNSFISKEYIKEELSNNPFGKVLVLKEDKIIGYLYYSDIYDRAEINQFEIEESERNSGKGNLLLKYLIDTVKKDITLEVREDNISAIHVYEKNGFVKKAIRKAYYNGIDGILMERKYKDSLK